MHTDAPSIPPVIDVEAELGHWRAQHAAGALGNGSFGHYVPWVKFACDSLLTHPRSSNAERDALFQTHYALQIMPRLTEQQARVFVEQVWEHVYKTSAAHAAERPRLRA